MKRLSENPTVHELAMVRDSKLGKWIEVGARTVIFESEMDDYSYVVQDSQIAYSTIGKFCSIASHARLNPGNHPLDRPALNHFTYRAAQFDLGEDDDGFFDWRRASPVSLGHDVWIGHGATVMPGVSIGTGAAIGSGAVVTKDIPPFAVAVGVPARPIRSRFADEVTQDLMEIAWWDWSHDELKKALQDFRQLGIEEFVEKYK